MLYYYMVNNQTEESNLNPVDKIKICEYEVERQKEIIKGLEAKLEVAKKHLSDKIEDCNNCKKEGKKFLQEMLKEIK